MAAENVEREEVPLPTVRSKRAVMVLEFADVQDRALFERWLLRETGWAQFRGWIDEHTG